MNSSALVTSTSSPGPSPRRFHFENRRGEGPGDEVASNIGKTNRTLLVRTQEHALTDKESAIYKHLHDCDNIKHIQDLYNLPDIFTNENTTKLYKPLPLFAVFLRLRSRPISARKHHVGS